MAALDRFLQQLVADGGSDLHLSSTRPPYRRINGVLSPIAEIPPLSSQQVLGLVREIMPEANVRQLENEWDTDCAYELPGVARFRVNGFRDMCGYGAVLRVTAENIRAKTEAETALDLFPPYARPSSFHVGPIPLSPLGKKIRPIFRRRSS